MNEENQDKQDAQKTVVAFVVGLLVGGLLVWVFSGSGAEAPVDEAVDDEIVDEVTDDTDDTEADSDTTDIGDTSTATGDQAAGDKGSPEMIIGEAEVDVSDQPAGLTVALDGATFPTDTGWIGVRSYANGQLGSILGVTLYSKAEGLVPEEIPLVSPTVSGNEYAIVFFTEDGDRQFTLANDQQIDTPITNFTAR